MAQIERLLKHRLNDQAKPGHDGACGAVSL